jgi:hypothetical protein
MSWRKGDEALLTVLTRILLLLHSETLFRIVCPLMFERLREKVARQRAKHAAARAAQNEKWGGFFAHSNQDASKWQHKWEILCPMHIYTTVARGFDVQAYTAETSRLIDEDDEGVKRALGQLPFVARMHGLEVRSH